MKFSKRIPRVLALAIIFLVTLTSSQASTQLIANGNFESESTFGWAVSGGVMTARYSHSGYYSIRLGTRLGPGQISQQLQIPSGRSASLSFWYSATPGDQGATVFLATLLSQNGTVIAQWSGLVDSRWHQVTYTIGSKYDNQKLTIIFFGQPSYMYETVDHECPIRRIICARIILIPVSAYIDDVTVTYT